VIQPSDVLRAKATQLVDRFDLRAGTHCSWRRHWSGANYTFEACSSFTRVTACKVARPPDVGFCHEASSQPVTQLQCSLATRPNQHLSGRVLPPLVICAVGAHYETGCRANNLAVLPELRKMAFASRTQVIGPSSISAFHKDVVGGNPW